MLCDDCKKRPAGIHITKIINNSKVEKHLCSECAKHAGEFTLDTFTMENSVSVQDFLKGMFNYGAVASSYASKQETACEGCGMTYSEFSHHGKIGCSDCYTAFGERLEPLLRRIHGASSHTGKVPKRTGSVFEARQKLKRLRQELERHISREEYEQAATVRDTIRQLERSMQEETNSQQAEGGQTDVGQ